MEHHFISNRDIVMFSFQSWDTEIGSNFKDMATELAKKNRVLFVNRALDRSSLYKNKNDAITKTRLASIRQGINEIEQVAANIWVQNPRTIAASINGIPFAGIHDWLNKINGKRLSKQINKAIRQLGFSNVLLINDNDFIRGAYLKEMIACSEYIFYLRDYMLGVDFFKRHGPRLEKSVLQKADLVVANSDSLTSYAKKINPKSFYIGQGCNFTAPPAAGTPVPDDMRSISGPVIGYTGFISSWRINAAVIKHIAEQFPACSVVLVGPADPLFKKETVSLPRNVYFLGAKSPGVLANYIKYFDICINPQVLNEVTMGNYPRKADEYLAMGKPLVATATDGMKMFAPYCFLCISKEEFVEKIHYILNNREATNNDTMQQQRIAFALSHTWEESMGLLGDAYYSLKN